MTLFGDLSFDLLVVSLLATVAIREMLIIVLPDTIAGPEGWLIRIGESH